MWAVGLSVQAVARKVCVDLVFCGAKIRKNEIVVVQKGHDAGGLKSNPREIKVRPLSVSPAKWHFSLFLNNYYIKLGLAFFSAPKNLNYSDFFISRTF